MVEEGGSEWGAEDLCVYVLVVSQEVAAVQEWTVRSMLTNKKT